MMTFSVRYPTAELKDLATMRAMIKDSAMTLGGDAEPVAELQIAADEAITNIILHGYMGQPGFIEISIEREDDDIRLCLLDSAPAFDPTSIPTPDVTVPLALRPYGGMGVHMMTSFTDELSYRLTAGGLNELTLTKRNAVSKSSNLS